MSERMALIISFHAKENIHIKEFLIKNEQIIRKNYNLNELFEDVCRDGLEFTYDDIIESASDCMLIKDSHYIIFLIRNSAGFPEIVEVNLLDKINSDMYVTYTEISLPS